MKRITLYSFVVLLMVIASCSDDDDILTENYTPGDVIIRYKISTPLDSIYHLVDSYNLVFDEVLHYTYILNITTDSIQYYDSLLKAKEYLHDNISPPGILNNNGIITAELGFNTLNDSIANDWFNFKNDHNFQHLPITNTIESSAFLKVPIGKEKYWAEVLRKSPFLTNADVNHIFRIDWGDVVR